MKTKQLIITILMITFVTMITTKVEATENDEQVEQTQNIENIEKDKQYNLTKEVKVKTLPLIFAIEKETIPSGNIRVTDILNDWCKIENEGKSGWIRINTIKTSVKQDNNQEEAKKEENLNTEGNNNQEQTNSSNEEESNQNQQENKTEEVTEISKTGYVKADGLNIRKEPTTSSEAIHSLSFNSKVKITGEIDGWYRIDYNDQIGYVSQKYVSDTKLPETTARGGYDRTTASSEENTVANQEAVEENQVETEEEQEEESTASATSSEGNDVVEFAKKYNILVVHDNAYSEIEYDGRRGFSFLSIPGAKDVGIEFNSLSKTYNLTGLRISFALGNADVIKHFKTIRSQFDYGTSYIVQKAAVAALNGPQDGVVKQQAQYQSRRDALCDGLNAIGWKVPYSEGTMFVWAPVPKQFKNSDEFCIQMLENTGVVCTPGSAFGSLGENHVRFALVLNENLIKEAVEKIKEWFEKENIEL